MQAQASRQTLIVIGNGMAAMRTVEHILEHQAAANVHFDITVIGSEQHGNYNRIMLSPVLADEKTFGDIMLHTPEWYQQQSINLLSGKTVIAIDRQAQQVILDDNAILAYDKCLIATGSNPFVLPITGKDLDGVVSYRTIEDVYFMQTAAKAKKHAVVIGAGVLGLEAAYGLLKQGMQVSVVHNEAAIMNRQLDATAAQLLQSHLEKTGIRFYLNKLTKEFQGSDHVERVVFNDGEIIAADLVVMAVGIRSNIALAKQANLDSHFGIQVDDFLQTSDKNIFAVGECVEHRKKTYGLVAPLFEQAQVCAKQLLGLPTEPYLGSQIYTSLKVTGVNLYSAGDFYDGDVKQSIVYHDKEKHIYKKLVIQDNKLIGVNLYGDIADSVWYQDLLLSGEDVSLLREALIFGQAFLPEKTAGEENNNAEAA